LRGGDNLNACPDQGSGGKSQERAGKLHTCIVQEQMHPNNAGKRLVREIPAPDGGDHPGG
jgi:hypothetical protein